MQFVVGHVARVGIVCDTDNGHDVGLQCSLVLKCARMALLCVNILLRATVLVLLCVECGGLQQVGVASWVGCERWPFVGNG